MIGHTNRNGYWLIPLVNDEPMVWGGQAEWVNAEEAGSLISVARTIHPRWLMMFKWQALFADSDESCGMGDMDADQWLKELLHARTPIHWSDPEAKGSISHCAEAFFDARLRLDETLSIWNALPDSADVAKHHPRIRQIVDWRRSGIDAFLLKGDE